MRLARKARHNESIPTNRAVLEPPPEVVSAAAAILLPLVFLHPSIREEQAGQHKRTEYRRVGPGNLNRGKARRATRPLAVTHTRIHTHTHTHTHSQERRAHTVGPLSSCERHSNRLSRRPYELLTNRRGGESPSRSAPKWRTGLAQFERRRSVSFRSPKGL